MSWRASPFNVFRRLMSAESKEQSLMSHIHVYTRDGRDLTTVEPSLRNEDASCISNSSCNTNDPCPHKTSKEELQLALKRMKIEAM